MGWDGADWAKVVEREIGGMIAPVFESNSAWPFG